MKRTTLKKQATRAKAEKAAARETKAIQGHIDRLNATQATKSMALLEKAVDKVPASARPGAVYAGKDKKTGQPVYRTPDGKLWID